MFGEMGTQDKSKIWSGLQPCGEEVSESRTQWMGAVDMFSVCGLKTGGGWLYY